MTVNTVPPGPYVNVVDAPSAVTTTSTGTAFAAGLTVRGPVGIPIELSQLADFATLCGPRTNVSSVMWDAAEVYFTINPSGTMYVSRVVGPAALPATVTLSDAGTTPQPTLKVSAIGPGTDGNNLGVQVVTGPITGTFVLEIFYSGALVETSPALSSPSDATNWGTLNPANMASVSSKWVTITNLGSTNTNPNPAVVGPVSLTSGADDNSNAGDTQYTAALTALPSSLGPGTVFAPGRNTPATWLALDQHAQTHNRFAPVDVTNGATAAATSTAAAAFQAAANTSGGDPSYSTAVGPWVSWPGIPTGTVVQSWPRLVAPSAVFAGLVGLSDQTNDCNIAAAGPDNGVVANALGVAQTFSDSDRLLLDNAGVSVIRNIRGVVQLYGYNTLATDPNWTDLANARLRMQLVDEATTIAAGYEFSQVDDAGTVLADFGGALTDMLTVFYLAGSLYGATSSDAFTVNVGSTVNTAQTVAARQLNAVLSVRMSPSARTVDIGIVKYPVTSLLPAIAA